MIKGPGSSSTVDETDTPLVLGREKTGISSPTLSRGANGLGGLPVSLAVAIEVSFSLLNYPPPRHAPVDRQFDFVIFTAGIGGSISTQPHLAVPNRRPAPFYSERAEYQTSFRTGKWDVDRIASSHELSPGPETANAARPSSTPFGSAPRRASSVHKPLGRAKAALSRSSDAHPKAR